jgi:hypothetical protein
MSLDTRDRLLLTRLVTAVEKLAGIPTVTIEAAPEPTPTGSVASAIRRDYTQGGRVVETAREQMEREAEHPHLRPDPEMYRPKTPRRLPLGERFE